MPEPLVTAVVVTWNRRALLAESLAAVLAQIRPADRVIVVDNASTDGTAGMLESQFPQVNLVRLPANTGGAGGFATGLTAALAQPCDACWLMDDDTVPEPEALAELLAVRRRCPGSPPALVASRVVWTDGRDHPMNTPRPWPWASPRARAAARACAAVPVRSASFVSVLIEAEAVRARGLPVADYFLWNDDFEFTTRVIRGGVGLLASASVVEHRTQRFASTDEDPGERFFYEVRNKVWLFTRSRGLALPEKAVYLGSTLARWARTLARSHDRVTLVRALGRGLAVGFAHGPRPNNVVLSALASTGGGSGGG